MKFQVAIRPGQRSTVDVHDLPDGQLLIGRYPPQLTQDDAPEPYTLIDKEHMPPTYRDYLVQQFGASFVRNVDRVLILPVGDKDISRRHLLLKIEDELCLATDLSRFGCFLIRSSNAGAKKTDGDTKAGGEQEKRMGRGVATVIDPGDRIRLRLVIEGSDQRDLFITLHSVHRQWRYRKPEAVLDATAPASEDTQDGPLRLRQIRSTLLLRCLPELYRSGGNNGYSTETSLLTGDIDPLGDFFPRFLAIYETLLLPSMWMLDDLDILFNPRTAPREFLSWFSDWYPPLDENASEAIQRVYFANAYEIYSGKGTKRSLQKLIEIYTGQTPQIVEPHDPDGIDLPPDTFRVILRPGIMDETRIASLIERHKPSHTRFELKIQLPNA